MAEVLIRIDPVPMAAFSFAGGTMALVPAARRYSLRGTASGLQAFVPVKLPTKIGDVSDTSDGLAVMLGPDEWLLIGGVAGDSAGHPVSITEITERQIGLAIEGPRAAELLMSGCPLDLERMAATRGTRTIYETVEIVVIKRSDTRFHVEVWRSFAPWLWAALASAAQPALPPAKA